MVALRRPDDLPAPEEDGLPVRPIKPHTLDKLDYWGRYINDASTATMKKFPGSRMCVDLFAAFGVCEDTKAKRRVWGSSLIALQVDVPYDLYVLNDIDPDATAALANRARRSVPRRRLLGGDERDSDSRRADGGSNDDQLAARVRLSRSTE